MTPFAVLFVCTGNICRSPTAEGVFRHYAARSNLSNRLLIDSAGTHGYHVGEPPDSRAIAAAFSRGVDLKDLRARKFTSEDFGRFDLIVAMDSGHHAAIRRLAANGARATLFMFMDFVPDGGIVDVPDPYYGDARDFEYVFDLIERGAQGLLAHIGERLKL